MDVSNIRLDKAEQRFSELKCRSGKLPPKAAQEGKERENTKEKLRDLEGKTRRSKLPSRRKVFLPERCRRRRTERMGDWQRSIFPNGWETFILRLKKCSEF